MKVIKVYWGYLTGEGHLTDEQLANIDFGNPAVDTEFITFDPLASSYFEGKFFRMFEKKMYHPHRTLPSMRSETMILYEDTAIKIFDPPADLETPVGILLCIFAGKQSHIERALKFLRERINVKFSPCEIDFELFYNKIVKTRLKIKPVSMTISNLRIDEKLIGDLEVFLNDHELFQKNIKYYKPKCQMIRLLLTEVNFQFELKVRLDGTILFEHDTSNLNLQNTLYDVVSRSVFTGNDKKTGA